jgi:hypothetical protein
MASDYCYGVEMQHALKRHDAGEARVIPTILRWVDWEDAPFSKLQVLPSNAEPVTHWSDRDKAFWDVTRGIRSVAKELATTLKTDIEWIEEGNTLADNKHYNGALRKRCHKRREEAKSPKKLRLKYSSFLTAPAVFAV